MKWRPGGWQLAAFHAPTHRLFVLMHEGGKWTHKVAGEEVWVFDTETKQRIHRLHLPGHRFSIAVTQDEQPLLFALSETASISVFDATTWEHKGEREGLGDLALHHEHLRRVSGAGLSMTLDPRSAGRLCSCWQACSVLPRSPSFGRWTLSSASCTTTVWCRSSWRPSIAYALPVVELAIALGVLALPARAPAALAAAILLALSPARWRST